MHSSTMVCNQGYLPVLLEPPVPALPFEQETTQTTCKTYQKTAALLPAL